MWIFCNDQILVIDHVHVKNSSVCNAYTVMTPLQAMEQHFGSDHELPPLCRDLAENRNFDWLQWRDPLSEPPIPEIKLLELGDAIHTLRTEFDTIFKPCIVHFPNVDPHILRTLVDMLKDIGNPPSDMYDSVLKASKLKNWRTTVNEATRHFIDKYTSSSYSIPLLVQVMALAYIMDIAHLLILLGIMLTSRIDFWDTEAILRTFGIPEANNESATVKLQEVLKSKIHPECASNPSGVM